MNLRSSFLRCVLIALYFATPMSAQGAEENDLEVLRLTVVNLLQGMVQKGVLTPEEAANMVRQAQESAESVAGVAESENDELEEEQVRVTYVPEVVKEELREDLQTTLEPRIVESVIDAARDNGWAMAEALPGWLSRTRITGDFRIRGRADFFDSGNALNVYRDFQRINEAGGDAAAGFEAFTNVSEDRQRLQGRLRLGLTSQLTDQWRFDLRLSSGDAESPVSVNTTLASYNQGYEISIDRALLTYQSDFERWGSSVRAGRMGSPWIGTDIVFDNDLNFDGLVGHLHTRGGNGSFFWTAGGFPIDEVSRSSRDKWLLGSQLGWISDEGRATRFEVALAYHDYQNITGKRNALDSVLLDFTAPAFVQRGNTLFDIRNDTDVNTNLYALAADYDLATFYARLSLFEDRPIGAALAIEVVKNIGFEEDDVRARTGLDVEDKTNGYIAEIQVGHHSLDLLWNWRMTAAYRYLERDAVLDAYADSPFHLGGTDAQGYDLMFDLGLSARTWLTLSWLSADEIDGPPLGVDGLFLDINSRF